jgi:hypothetical protein
MALIGHFSIFPTIFPQLVVLRVLCTWLNGFPATNFKILASHSTLNLADFGTYLSIF